jgi:hypothetical protein
MNSKNYKMMKLIKIICTWVIVMVVHFFSFSQNTVSDYYVGDIPTSLQEYNESCNGSATTISVTLPPGDNYTVTNTTIEYYMVATAPGVMADQASKLLCVNTSLEEPEQFGVGATPGAMYYNRTSNIANGTYPGGTTITFHIYALRTTDDGAGNCSTTTNKIESESLEVTVHFEDEVLNPKVAINAASATQTLDVNGKIKVGNDSTEPLAGTMRFNTQTNDFEGFDGMKWISFTQNANGEAVWGSQTVHENYNAKRPSAITSNNEQYGRAVCVDEFSAAIGCPGKKVTTFESAGIVNTKSKFSLAGDWADDQVIVATDPQSFAGFGASVDIYQNFMVIGSPNYDVSGHTDQGKAYVYYKFGDDWFFATTLVAPDGSPGDLFGTKVDIFENYIAISAPSKNIGSMADVGKVYLFEHTDSGWEYLTAVVPPTPQALDQFGLELNLTFQYLVVGAPLKDNATTLGSGAVYLYKRQVDNFIFEDEFLGDFYGLQFGTSIATNGIDLFVGAPAEANDNIPEVGNVYRFHKFENVFYFEDQIKPTDFVSGLKFGLELSIHNNDLLIGSAKSVGNNEFQGAVDLYSFDRGTWCYKAQFTPSDGAANDGFGSSISIYETDVFIGASNKAVGAYSQAGQAYIFKKN